MNQEQIFKEFESDKWYLRNRENLKPKDDLVTFLIELYQLIDFNSKVLEIGASNGYRLAKIYEKYKCEVVAVEPSKKAVEEGCKEFPYIKFLNITAEDVDFSEDYDLIIVNSVLHWIDRKNLLKVIHNIDKALKYGGYLIIGDFQLPFPIKNRYHHIEKFEVFTYKLRYKEIFISTGFYYELANLCYNHDTKDFNDINLKNLFSLSLLKKENIYLNQQNLYP